MFMNTAKRILQVPSMSVLALEPHVVSVPLLTSCKRFHQFAVLRMQHLLTRIVTGKEQSNGLSGGHDAHI